MITDVFGGAIAHILHKIRNFANEKMIKSYKYRLSPSKEQEVLFEKFFNSTRFIYNWALRKKIDAYNKDGTQLGWMSLCRELTNLKKQRGMGWLSEAPNQSLQSAIRHMNSAFTHFFREYRGFPKFKAKKHFRHAFQYVQNVQIDFERCRIRLPKVGEVKFCKNRCFVGSIGTVTISKTATGKYYASLVVDDGKDLPQKVELNADTAVGVDVGLKDYAVLSNGKVFACPPCVSNEEKRLEILQKRLARKRKWSRRWVALMRAVTKQHEIVCNVRANFLHKVTSMIVRENQTIIIEDLNIAGMLKNRTLSKRIIAARWAEFFRLLQYKCEWYGKNFIRIGRFDPSSKMCVCGHIYKQLKMSERIWVCPECGRTNDRDLLAANNIKRFGLQRIKDNNYTPAAGRGELAELPIQIGTLKREYVQVV